jgi:hypothetical protein
MASKMPKPKKAMASQPMGRESLSPVYTGPGLNLAWPQTRRQRMGVPHATLLPATAREKRAAAAAGAMRQRRPSTQAARAHPQTVRTGIISFGDT